MPHGVFREAQGPVRQKRERLWSETQYLSLAAPAATEPSQKMESSQAGRRMKSDEESILGAFLQRRFDQRTVSGIIDMAIAQGGAEIVLETFVQ